MCLRCNTYSEIKSVSRREVEAERQEKGERGTKGEAEKEREKESEEEEEEESGGGAQGGKWCTKKPASTLDGNLKVPGSIPGSSLREIIHPKTTSYIGIMGDRFDLKLIPEFVGSTPVHDWVEKAEQHCLLSGVKNIEHVIPLRLSGGAFTVYQQLSAEKKNRNMRGSRQHYTKRLLSTPPLPGSNLRQEHYIQAKLWTCIWPS